MQRLVVQTPDLSHLFFTTAIQMPLNITDWSFFCFQHTFVLVFFSKAPNVNSFSRFFLLFLSLCRTFTMSRKSNKQTIDLHRYRSIRAQRSLAPGGGALKANIRYTPITLTTDQYRSNRLEKHLKIVQLRS